MRGICAETRSAEPCSLLPRQRQVRRFVREEHDE